MSYRWKGQMGSCAYRLALLATALVLLTGCTTELLVQIDVIRARKASLRAETFATESRRIAKECGATEAQIEAVKAYLHHVIFVYQLEGWKDRHLMSFDFESAVKVAQNAAANGATEQAASAAVYAACVSFFAWASDFYADWADEMADPGSPDDDFDGAIANAVLAISAREKARDCLDSANRVCGGQSQAITATESGPGPQIDTDIPQKTSPGVLGEKAGEEPPDRLPGFPIDKNSSVEADQNFNISGVDFFSTNPTGEPTAPDFSGTYTGNFTIVSDPNVIDDSFGLTATNPHNLAVVISSVSISGSAPFINVKGPLNADRKSFSSLTDNGNQTIGGDPATITASNGMFTGSGGPGSTLKFRYIANVPALGGSVVYDFDGNQ